MLHEFIDRFTAWASASPFRTTLVRYVGTIVVMLTVIGLSVVIPLRDSAWIVVVVAILACSWLGGVGPSLLAPLLLVMSVRLIQKGTAHVLDFSSKEFTDLAVFLMLTAAVGWSGQTRRRAQAQIRGQSLELQAEARRKDHFLATLAHELRNPLAPLRTGFEILRLAGNDAAGQRLVRETHEIMERQVDQLVRLIDDLLDLSRINSGKIELRRERVRLGDVIRDAVDASQPHMQAAGHDFAVQIQNPELVLDADRARLAQVLLNLLNNAAKFTPPGGHILLADARVAGQVEIRVRDSGIGIPADQLPQIFGMFTQLDDPQSHAQRGLGIGLNLVKTLVEMHGGTVTARSDGPGCGAEFVVRLPIPPAEPAGQQDHPPGTAGAPNGSAPRRVLVVDDNEDAARGLAKLLTMKGHHCCTAFAGPAALEMASEFEPDAVVLDIGMPGMNGYDVVQHLRATPRGEKFTLIAVTGWGQEADRRQSAAAGFDHHLVKPVDINVLEGLLTATGRPPQKT